MGAVGSKNFQRSMGDGNHHTKVNLGYSAGCAAAPRLRSNVLEKQCSIGHNEYAYTLFMNRNISTDLNERFIFFVLSKH